MRADDYFLQIEREVRILKKRRRRRLHMPQSATSAPPLIDRYDKIYYAIGVVCVAASVFKLCELIFALCT